MKQCRKDGGRSVVNTRNTRKGWVSRPKQLCASFEQRCFSSHNLIRCYTKVIQNILDVKYNSLFLLYVPASMVTPPRTPTASRLSWLVQQPSKLGQETGSRPCQKSQRRRLSSTDFHHKSGASRSWWPVPGVPSAPPSCRSPHALSSPLKDNPQW